MGALGRADPERFSVAPAPLEKEQPLPCTPHTYEDRPAGKASLRWREGSTLQEPYTVDKRRVPRLLSCLTKPFYATYT